MRIGAWPGRVPPIPALDIHELSDLHQEIGVRPATPSDLATIIDLLEEAAEWLETKGVDQWPIG